MKYFLCLALLFTGCAKRASVESASMSDLSRQQVLELLHKQLAPKVVQAHMNTSSNTLRNLTPIYTQMIEERIIACDQGSPSCGCWIRCRPAGQEMGDLYLELEEQGSVSGSLAIDIGIKQINEVTGISFTDTSSAVAEYLIAYTQNDDKDIAPFKKYPDVFRSDDTQNEKHRAYLRKYDDGWRIERLE